MHLISKLMAMGGVTGTHGMSEGALNIKVSSYE